MSRQFLSHPGPKFWIGKIPVNILHMPSGRSSRLQPINILHPLAYAVVQGERRLQTAVDRVSGCWCSSGVRGLVSCRRRRSLRRRSRNAKGSDDQAAKSKRRWRQADASVLLAWVRCGVCRPVHRKSLLFHSSGTSERPWGAAR